MNTVCNLHGITRSAYYKHRWVLHERRPDLRTEQALLDAIHTVRAKQPFLGGLKLLTLVRATLHSPVMGRDRFFAFLAAHSLLIEPKRRFCITTNSFHRFHVYENCLPSLDQLTAPNQVLVSDITYIALDDPRLPEHQFAYLALVTDMYSRKIVGYDLSLSLSIDGALRALQMALEQIPDPSTLLHHSDRGIQYCSHRYIEALKGAKVSMADAGDPYQNAVAERINGILKQEFSLNQSFRDYTLAHNAVREAVKTYNHLRPHRSLNFMTPDQKHAA